MARYSAHHNPKQTRTGRLQKHASGTTIVRRELTLVCAPQLLGCKTASQYTGQDRYFWSTTATLAPSLCTTKAMCVTSSVLTHDMINQQEKKKKKKQGIGKIKKTIITGMKTLLALLQPFRAPDRGKKKEDGKRRSVFMRRRPARKEKWSPGQEEPKKLARKTALKPWCLVKDGGSCRRGVRP